MDIEVYINEILHFFDVIKLGLDRCIHLTMEKHPSSLPNENLRSISKKINDNINRILASGVIQVYHKYFWSESSVFYNNCLDFAEKANSYSDIMLEINLNIERNKSHAEENRRLSAIENLTKIANDFNEYLEKSISTIPNGVDGLTKVYDIFNSLSNQSEQIKILNDDLIDRDTHLQSLNTKLEIKNLEINGLINDLDQAKKNAKANKEKEMIKKTHEIYSNAAKNNLNYARGYDVLFYIVLIVLVVSTYRTWVSFITAPDSNYNLILFITLKITLLSVGITLGSLFLRKASHLRKLYHNYNHLALELNSLPSYLTNIEEQQHSRIYNDLIKNYYGNSMDNSQIDKSGDLINEQIKNSIELVKASTDLAIKAQNLEQKNK